VQLAALRERLTAAGAVVDDAGAGALTVVGVDAAGVGDAAYAAGVRLHELTGGNASLEDAYHRLTADSVQFAGSEGEAR
jgi:ABC-2 type transport system ATP-binding protein